MLQMTWHVKVDVVNARIYLTRSPMQECGEAENVDGDGHSQFAHRQRICEVDMLIYVDMWIYVDKRICGYAEMWICGYVNMLICGYADMWICGYVDMQICGYVDMWICWYADMWTYGYADMWICKYADISGFVDIRICKWGNNFFPILGSCDHWSLSLDWNGHSQRIICRQFSRCWNLVILGHFYLLIPNHFHFRLLAMATVNLLCRQCVRTLQFFWTVKSCDLKSLLLGLEVLLWSVITFRKLHKSQFFFLFFFLAF